MTTFYTHADSPLGPILLTSDGAALTGLYLADGRHTLAIAPEWIAVADAAPFAEARQQLCQYFAGERTAFTLPLAPEGTPFQQRVWAALRAIPYGETISYGELARRLGDPGAARAVGLANGRNPISIVVPCHRVIGASGKLTGYAGGLSRKESLLAFESAVRTAGPRPFPTVSAPITLDL